MNKRKTIVETIKTTLIVLLVISAVLLGWASRLFGNTSAKLADIPEVLRSITGSTTQKSTSGTTDVAMRPICIALTNEAGVHYGVKYSKEDLSAIYNRTAVVVGEALGSAQNPAEVEESSWQAALGTSGVYYEYAVPVRLSVLDGWFGVDISGDWGALATRRLVVTYEGGINKLFFQDDSTGSFYMANTETLGSVEGLSDATGSGNAVFTFERDPVQIDQDLYALLLPDVIGHPVIEAKNPLTDETVQAEALLALGVSEHVLVPYVEPNGTKDYIGKEFKLRVWTDGTITYQLNETAEETENQNESTAIETARQKVFETIGAYCGSADVYFDSIQATENGYVIRFKYYAAGGQVYLHDDGYAASVTIQNGIISDMVLRFRSYNITTKEIKLLPEIQAAAASGGAFMLCYPDNGGNTLNPVWVNIVS